MSAGPVAAGAAATPEPARWQASFVALAAIWGSSFLFIKLAGHDLAPVEVAFGRVAIGGVTLLVTVLVTGQRLPRDRGLWAHLAVVALILNVLPFTLFAYGEHHVSSIVAGIWNGTTPLLVLVASIAMLPDERPTRRRTAGLLLGFAGVVVVLGPWHGLGAGELRGHAACLVAAACYGVGFPYLRRYLTGRPESLVVIAAGQLICASAETAAWMAVTGQGHHGGLSLQTIGAMLSLGVLGTGLAYPLNYTIVRAAGVSIASTVTYVIPIFSTVLGIVILGEALTFNQPLGAVLVLAGVAVSQGRLRRPSRAAGS